jgi:hypothetical protein
MRVTGRDVPDRRSSLREQDTTAIRTACKDRKIRAAGAWAGRLESPDDAP